MYNVRNKYYDIFKTLKNIHIWLLNFQIIIPFPIFGTFHCRGRLVIRLWSDKCLNHLRLPVLQTRPEGYEINIWLNDENNMYTYTCILHFRVKRNKYTSLLEINMDVTGFKCMFNKDILNILISAWCSASLTHVQLVNEKFPLE